MKIKRRRLVTTVGMATCLLGFAGYVAAQPYPVKPVRFIVPFTQADAPGHVSRRPARGTGVQAAGFYHAAVTTTQDYPSKPIRLIVPFVPGGGTDLTARVLSPRLTEALGQSVVVDNRAGAGGVIGADIVAKAPADGYTLLMGTPGPLTINPALVANMPYTLADFAPVVLATVSPFMLVVHPSVPVKSVRELIALAHSKPNTLNYGSAGNGSVSHLAGEQFKALAGVQITHVPYKGGGQSLIDLIGGQLQMVIDNLPTVLPQVRLGNTRDICAMSSRRTRA